MNAENAHFPLLNQRQSAFSPALTGGARVCLQNEFLILGLIMFVIN
jgi:hypothetical protein